jgi:hypothetical protein
MKQTHSVPTPTASDHIERKCTSSEALNFETNKSVSLDRWVKMWPTPRASEVANGKNIQGGLGLTSTIQAMEQTTGKLNPLWVEWLMGFPIGWTDLEGSATQ